MHKLFLFSSCMCLFLANLVNADQAQSEANLTLEARHGHEYFSRCHSKPYAFATASGGQVIPDNISGSAPLSTDIVFDTLNNALLFDVVDGTNFTPLKSGSYLVNVSVTLVGQSTLRDPTLQIFLNGTEAIGAPVPLSFSIDSIDTFTVQAIVDTKVKDGDFIDVKITTPVGGLGIIVSSASITVVSTQ